MVFGARGGMRLVRCALFENSNGISAAQRSWMYTILRPIQFRFPPLLFYPVLHILCPSHTHVSVPLPRRVAQSAIRTHS